MFDKRSDLLKFLAVIETGKIQLAAEKTQTTQPALSRIIAKLEEQFRGQLFERIPTGVQLTPFGSFIAQQVRHVVREMELAENEIGSVVSGQTGELRVSTGPIWMRAYFPNVIRKFHESYPGIQLQLRTRNYREGVNGLIDGSLDLHCGGFGNDAPLPQFLNRESMMRMEIGVVANAAHPIFSKENPSYDDLVAYPWLAYMGQMGFYVGAGLPMLNDCLDDIYERCGKRVDRIVRCDASGLFLLGTAPYFSQLAMIDRCRFAGQPLRQVPLELPRRFVQAGIVARRSIESTSAFRDFKYLLETEIEQHA